MNLRTRKGLAAQKSRRQFVRRQFFVESLEPRLLLTGVDYARYADTVGCPMTDVNGDGNDTSLDALLVIDEVQRNGGAARRSPFASGGSLHNPDTNGDLIVNYLDAANVIHRLTALGTGKHDPLWCKQATVDFSQVSQPSFDTLLPGQTKPGFEFEVREGDRDVVFHELGLTVTNPTTMNAHDVSADLFVDSNHDDVIDSDTDTLLANGVSHDGRRIEFGGFNHDLPIIPQRFGVFVTGSRSFSGSEIQLDWDLVSGEGPFVATDKLNGSEVTEWGIGHGQATNFTLIPHGTVIVEHGLEPLRSHQIVAGTISERAVASVDYVALDEPAEIRKTTVFAKGPGAEVVDRLRAYHPGEPNPFAIATEFDCAAPLPDEYDAQFCLTTPVVVEENRQAEILFRADTVPNFVVDAAGPVQFVIDGDVAPPEVAGLTSNKIYGPDGIAFDGSTVIEFAPQEIVQAKIEHVAPIGPEDGSVTSPGYQDIGGFEFFVGHHQNHNEGEVQAFVPALTVEIIHPNVDLDFTDAWLFNDQDISQFALPASIVEVGPGHTRLSYVGLNDEFVNHAGSQESIPLMVNTNIIGRVDSSQPGSIRMDLPLDENRWAAGVDEVLATEYPFDLTETVIRGNTVEVG